MSSLFGLEGIDYISSVSGGGYTGMYMCMKWFDPHVPLCLCRNLTTTLSHSTSHTHTHTLISTLHYTCCCDEIKGIQDLKICSHADLLSCVTVSPRLSLDMLTAPRPCLFTLTQSHTHTLTHSHTLLITCTCCYDQLKGTQDKDFAYSFSDSLSTCFTHCLTLWIGV